MSFKLSAFGFELGLAGDLLEDEADHDLGYGHNNQTDDGVEDGVLGAGNGSITAAAGDVAEAADNNHNHGHDAND